MSIKILSKSPKETFNLGMTIARHCKPGDIICMEGNLGAGKTTLTQGIAAGLNINAKSVVSLTFVFLNIYNGTLTVYHFDLYRLENLQELFNIGYEEFFYSSGLAVIEWAERLKTLKPKQYLKIELK